jgi:hypothetical protein
LTTASTGSFKEAVEQKLTLPEDDPEMFGCSSTTCSSAMCSLKNSKNMMMMVMTISAVTAWILLLMQRDMMS